MLLPSVVMLQHILSKEQKYTIENDNVSGSVVRGMMDQTEDFVLNCKFSKLFFELYYDYGG